MNAFDTWIQYRRITPPITPMTREDLESDVLVLPSSIEPFTPGEYVIEMQSPAPTDKQPVDLHQSVQLTLPVQAIEQNALLAKRIKPPALIIEQAPLAPMVEEREEPKKISPPNLDKPHLIRIRDNAYRVLGLGADADYPTIQTQANRLKLQARLGQSSETPWDFGQVERTESHIQDALWRLGNPMLRIQEKLFWTTYLLEDSNDSIPDEADESELLNLDGHKAQNFIFHLLIELSNMERMAHLPTWWLALSLWCGVIEDENFWENLYNEDKAGQFPQPVRKSDIQHVRESLWDICTEGFVSEARQSVLDKNETEIQAFLETLQKATLPEHRVITTQEAIFGFLKTEMEKQYDAILEENYKSDALIILQKELIPVLSRFKKHLHPRSPLRYDAQEMVVQCIYRMLTLWNWDLDDRDFKTLYKLAKKHAPKDSLVLPRIELWIKGHEHHE